MQADLFARWGTPIERERWRRISLCVWAYAYELLSAPMVHDDHYDMIARQSNPTLITGRYDDWWRETFAPHTGQWIHSHPDLTGVAALHRLWTNDR
jgi:hypothetical protein